MQLKRMQDQQVEGRGGSQSNERSSSASAGLGASSSLDSRSEMQRILAQRLRSDLMTSHSGSGVSTRSSTSSLPVENQEAPVQAGSQPLLVCLFLFASVCLCVCFYLSLSLSHSQPLLVCPCLYV